MAGFRKPSQRPAARWTAPAGLCRMQGKSNRTPRRSATVKQRWLPIEAAPLKVRDHGLRDAHSRPWSRRASAAASSAFPSVSRPGRRGSFPAWNSAPKLHPGSHSRFRWLGGVMSGWRRRSAPARAARELGRRKPALRRGAWHLTLARPVHSGDDARASTCEALGPHL